jgi:hypothetical protein
VTTKTNIGCATVTTTVTIGSAPAGGCVPQPTKCLNAKCKTVPQEAHKKVPQQEKKKLKAGDKKVNAYQGFHFGRKFFGRRRNDLSKVGSQQAAGAKAKHFILDLVKRMKQSHSGTKFQDILKQLRLKLSKQVNRKVAGASKAEIGQVPMLVQETLRKIGIAQPDSSMSPL